MEENKEVLLEMWSETPKSINHRLWDFKVMQAFNKNNLSYH